MDVFLDNNVWNMLADGRAPFSLTALTAAYRHGRVRVVGTLELFEEIAATGTRWLRKYRRMSALFHKLVGRRVLLPLDLRHRQEVEHGGVLPEEHRYLSRSARREVRDLAGRPALIAALNDVVHQRKLRHHATDVAMKADIVDEVKSMGKRMKDFDRSLSVETIRDAVRDVVKRGPAHGLPSVPERDITAQRLPSAWWLSAATAARATRAAGENRAVKVSDNHDRLHLSAAGYFDVFVTDDAELRATADLIPQLPLRIMSAREFSALLGERQTP